MIVAITSIITLLGLWIILRKYFTAAVTFATLLLLALGTNFFLMAIYSGAVQAGILLALTVLVVWMTQRWYEKPGWAEAIIAGLVMGGLIFIKPAGFASILLFFFWGSYNKETFNQKWKIYREHTGQVILVFGLFFAGLALRVIFPSAFEGTWFSGYVPHKRVLYFLAPNLWTVLCSIRNGWLIYTPLVLFSLPGFYILAERNKRIFYATFLFSLAFLLLIASSPDMTTPDNFSQARMTEIFAVIFIPMGYFVCRVTEGRWLRKTVFGFILIALAGLNLFQIWQYRAGILNPWFTTPEYYRAVFLKTTVNEGTRALQELYTMDVTSYLANEQEFNIRSLATYEFENDPGGWGGHIENKIFRSGKYGFRLDSSQRSTPPFGKNLGAISQKNLYGIRVSAWVYSEIPFPNNPVSLILTLKHNGVTYHYRPLVLTNPDLKPGRWNLVRQGLVINREELPTDTFLSHFWYTGNSAVYVDDISIELFEPKEK